MKRRYYVFRTLVNVYALKMKISGFKLESIENLTLLYYTLSNAKLEVKVSIFDD